MASADAVWMEYWMLDEITAAPLQGNDFLGYLVHDNVRKHFFCYRYVKGYFWMLDSLRKAQGARKMTLQDLKDATQGAPGVRYYRVFCQEGKQPRRPPSAAEPGEANPEKRNGARAASNPQEEHSIRTTRDRKDGKRGEEDRVSYGSVGDFRKAMREVVELPDRFAVFRRVLNGEIGGCRKSEDTPLFRCVVACQEWGFLQKCAKCTSCGATYSMVRKDAAGQEHWCWRGPRPAIARRDGKKRCVCYDATAGLARDDDFLSRAQQHMYPRFVDVLGMYLNGYPKKLLYNEMRSWGVGQKTVDAWVGAIQLEMAKWVQMRQREVNGLGGYGKTVQIDETAVNKRKRSALNRRTRRRRLRWVWGAVEQGRFDKSYLKILPDPVDAAGGKTRGKGEIEKCLMEAGIRPGTLCVTDGWKASKAADWGEIGCAHDFVVHSKGEIVGRRGQHTNLIEAKWSSMKRWMRSMCGGKVPGGERLEPYLFEYQWRQAAGGAVFAVFRDTVAWNAAAQARGRAPAQFLEPPAFGRAGEKYCLATCWGARGDDGQGESSDESSGANGDDDSDESGGEGCEKSGDEVSDESGGEGRGQNGGGDDASDGGADRAEAESGASGEDGAAGGGVATSPGAGKGRRQQDSRVGKKVRIATAKRTGAAELERQRAKRRRRRAATGRSTSDNKGRKEAKRRWRKKYKKSTLAGRESAKRSKKLWSQKRRKDRAASVKECAKKWRKTAAGKESNRRAWERYAQKKKELASRGE